MSKLILTYLLIRLQQIEDSNAYYDQMHTQHEEDHFGRYGY